MAVATGRSRCGPRCGRGCAPGGSKPPACRDLLRSTDNWILTGSAIFRRDCVTGPAASMPGSARSPTAYRPQGGAEIRLPVRAGIVASWVVFPDSVSRQTALDLQRTKYILDVVPTLIAADPGFPSWYADAFRDRWQFAACRLALQADPIARSVLFELGAPTAAEKAKLESILAWRIGTWRAWSFWSGYGIGCGRRRSSRCCGRCWRCAAVASLCAFGSGKYPV